MNPIPQRIIDSLTRYADDHIPTGDFLRAVLENNLIEAVGRADDDNKRILPEIVEYCYNEMPSNCWGSKEDVEDWLKKNL